MKGVKFREPNFKCTVARNDDPARMVTILEFGNSEQELRANLERLGYRVSAIQPYDFADWKRRADTATAEAIAAYDRGEKIKFKDALWGELKSYLFRIFNSQCAYCEAVVRDVSPGDVEHYRPKAGVDEEPEHPGYYWLAYNIDNWYPACPNCNQFSKKTHFPISGQRARKPTDRLDDEKPLLLNPYTINPDEHFSFHQGPSGPCCELKGTTPEGQASIDICGLNRPELKVARGNGWIRAQQDYLGLVVTFGSFEQARESFIRTLPNREFEAACLPAIRAYEKAFLLANEPLASAATGTPD